MGERHGGRARRGLGRADQAEVVARSQPVEQRREQARLVVALEPGDACGALHWIGGLVEMPVVQRVDVIRDPGAGGDLGVVGAGGGQALGGDAGVEPVALVRQPLGQRAAYDHDALVGAVGLVAGEEVDVRPQRAHVRQAMGA